MRKPITLIFESKGCGLFEPKNLINNPIYPTIIEHPIYENGFCVDCNYYVSFTSSFSRFEPKFADALRSAQEMFNAHVQSCLNENGDIKEIEWVLHGLNSYVPTNLFDLTGMGENQQHPIAPQIIKMSDLVYLATTRWHRKFKSFGEFDQAKDWCQSQIERFIDRCCE